MSTAYHPQTDGQTEAVNKCLEGYLRCYVTDKQQQWIKWVHMEKWWYNTNYHSSIKMSPFKALYGYNAPSIKDQLDTNSKIPAARDLLKETEDVIRIVKDNLEVAQNRMKQQADKGRSE